MDADLPPTHAWFPAPFESGVPDALFLGLAAACVGRIWLACLPPGLPGRHTARDLPSTWAASVLFGWTWCGVALAAGTTFDSGILASTLFVGPPIAAAIVLRALSPAALVPRHEPEPMPSGAVERGLLVAALAASPILAIREHGLPESVAALAVAILVNHALSLARVPAWVRCVALAGTALALGPLTQADENSEEHAVLGAAGAAGGLVAWIRRGDRRGLAVTAVGVAVLIGSDPDALPLATALAVATSIASGPRVRWRAAAASASGLVLGIAIARGTQTHGGYWAPVRLGSAADAERALLALVAALAAGALALHRLRARAPTWNPSGAPRGREAFALASAVGLALAFAWLRSFRPSDSLPSTTPALMSASTWILALVAAAIALARALERRPA